jgi:hypothetical protein
MTIIAVAIITAVAAAAIIWYWRQQRLTQLRKRFGPEYSRTVSAVGSARKADAVLTDRAKRVDRLKLHRLTSDQADAFAREWRRVQTRFVDDPDGAVTDADRLVTQVMAARGYPIEDFDRRAEDLSVDHPVVVENYRVARALAQRRERGEAGTEELRQAVVNYRALFEDLLEVRTHRRAS